MCSLTTQKDEDTTAVTLQLLNGAGKPLLEKPTPGGKRMKRTISEGSEGYGRVLVNGTIPDVRTTLKHMDRLIIGHAYCFRLVLPKRPGEGDEAEAADAATMDALHIMDALGEVVQDDTPEYQECRAMMDVLQDRIGTQKAHDFMKEFSLKLPLVQEANMITEDVRPDNKLRFKIEVCSDILNFTHDEPELIVRLYDDSGEEERVVDVFEIPQFQDRLDVMREVYQTLHHGEHAAEPWEHYSPQDPWATYNYKDVREILTENERRHGHAAWIKDEADIQLLNAEIEELEQVLVERDLRLQQLQEAKLGPNSPARLAKTPGWIRVAAMGTPPASRQAARTDKDIEQAAKRDEMSVLFTQRRARSAPRPRRGLGLGGSWRG
jgi:hypothetical protein